jgi:hypothetical protein
MFRTRANDSSVKDTGMDASSLSQSQTAILRNENQLNKLDF